MPDPLLFLPVELATTILRDAQAQSQAPRGYASIRISWVSRSWRRLALSDGHMWSTLSMRISTSKLLAFLERSRPLPFELICQPWYRTDDRALVGVVAVISQNLERFKSLELHDFGRLNPLKGIDGRDLPLLTSVRWYEIHCDCLARCMSRSYHHPAWMVPAQWTTCAPALRVLQLEHFVLQEWEEAQPLVSVRTLASHDLHESFTFTLFPKLQNLHLQGMSERCLPHLLSLPLSIQSVTLESSRWFSGNYSQFYQGLMQRRLPNLKLLSVCGLKAGSSDGIELLLQSTAGPYHVDGSFGIRGLRMESPSEGVCHAIGHVPGKFPYMWGRDITFAALIPRISSLSLHVSNLGLLESRHMAGTWDGSMPALRSLTLRADCSFWEVGALRLSVKPFVPQLQEVVFLSGYDFGSASHANHADVITRIVPYMLSEMLLIPLRLARITVRTLAEPETVAACNLAALGGIARVLCLREWESGAETEIPLPTNHILAALSLSS